MNSVLISIHPKWCDKIVSGEKTVEIRKTAPKIATPFKCYIYCTESGKYRNRKSVKTIWINRGTEQRFIGNGNIIGEFVCDEVYKIDNLGRKFLIGNDVALTNTVAKASCLDFSDMAAYAGDRKVLFAWHISKIQIYDEPRTLSDYSRFCDGLCFCSSKRYRCEKASKYSEMHYCDHLKRISRPPQSWMYVEDIK